MLLYVGVGVGVCGQGGGGSSLFSIFDCKAHAIGRTHIHINATFSECMEHT